MKKILLVSLAILSLSACNEEKVKKVTYGDMCKITQPSSLDETNHQVLLTPESLRDQLFLSNTSVLLGLNGVHQAKDQANIARAQLFPSLNLGSLLYSAANPTFTVSAVEILFPFLVPANWGRRNETQALFEAQGFALQAVRLNTYASAYSLYHSMLSDQNLRAIYQAEVDDLTQIESIVARLYQSGLASKTEVDRAQGQKEMARIGLSKISSLLAQEMALLRHTLALKADTQIELQNTFVTEADLEQASLGQVIDKAMSVAPEVRQMERLRKAAEDNVWSQQYAFIGGSSLRSPGGDGQSSSVAFDNASIGINFNIGYAQVPMVELSQDRLAEINIRTKELKYEITERSEYSLQLVTDSKSRAEMASRAEAAFQSVYTRDLARYKYGHIDLFNVLESRAKLREATIENLRAKTQLSLNRIVLHRLVMGDQFGKMPTCELK